ncbi:MAG: hypothetical protein QOE46_788 [Acidobacteriota bacterium]|jgi:hypothetical protein|nr:hypothetical protein [Acidobacteriota bacterium]
MRRTFYASTLALTLAALALTPSAQTTRGGASSRPAPASPQRAQAAAPVADLIPLPAADAVMLVDVRKLLTEVVPRSLSGDASRLAQVTTDIEQFKARTGIDARDFDSVAVGARLVKLQSGAVKVERLTAVARGRVNADALIASARTAAKGTLAEQQYGGKTIYVETINEQLKLFGLVKMHVRELALAVLDQNTLALGEPEDVRAAIDAQAGRGRADMSVLNFQRSAGDFVVFGGNVPAGLLSGAETGLPNVDRAIAAVRGFYGSIGSTPAGLQLMTTLRAQTAADAKQLFDTAEALRQVAPGLISATGEKGKFAQNAINSLKITLKANEVQLRLEVPQADISTLLRVL